MTSCVAKHDKQYPSTSLPKKFYAEMITEKFDLYMTIYGILYTSLYIYIIIHHMCTYVIIYKELII